MQNLALKKQYRKWLISFPVRTRNTLYMQLLYPRNLARVQTHSGSLAHLGIQWTTHKPIKFRLEYHYFIRSDDDVFYSCGQYIFRSSCSTSVANYASLKTYFDHIQKSSERPSQSLMSLWFVRHHQYWNSSIFYTLCISKSIRFAFFNFVFN